MHRTVRLLTHAARILEEIALMRACKCKWPERETKHCFVFSRPYTLSLFIPL